MSLRRMNNKTTAMICADGILKTNLPGVGDLVTPANLPKGAVVVTNTGLTRLASYPAAGDFLIVQGNGADEPLLKSEILNGARISISSAVFSPATQQITAIGFNGTTGSLPAANDTSFFIKIRKNDNDAGNRSQPMSLFAQFKTDATGTQEELAFGLVKVGAKNMEDEPANGYLNFTALCDEAGVAVTGTLTNLVFTKGSKEVVSDTNNVTVTNVNVGDVIKVAAALTTSVYKVTAVSNGTATTPAKITLNYAFQEETATVAKATARVITSAAAAAAEFGVRLTGVAAPFNVEALRDFYTNRFTATFSDDSTLVTHVQGATEGTGAWQRVAMDEYMTYGFEGMNSMIGVPPAPRDQYVVEGGKYSAIEVRWTESMNTLVTAHAADGSVLVYAQLDDVNEDIPNTEAGDDLIIALGFSSGDLDV